MKNENKLSFKNVVFSILPFVISLAVQVICGLVGGMIGSAMYAAKLVQEGKTEILQDMAAYTEGYLEFYQPSIIYILIASQLVSLLIFALWYRKSCKKEKLYLEPKHVFTLSSVGTIFLSAIGFQLLASAVIVVFSQMSPEFVDSQSKLLELVGIAELSPASLLATVILAPLSEELIFRGLIMKYLRKTGAAFLVANILQALFFGISHLNWIQGTCAFFLGLVLGYIAYKYQSVKVCVLFHLIYNLAVTVVPSVLSGMYRSAIGEAVSAVLGIALLVFAFTILRKKENVSFQPVNEAAQEVEDATV